MTWIGQWSDLIDFEVVPVVTSSKASTIVIAASE
jgi:hypothetical protein